MKWIGAFLIILSCGGFGFYQGINYRREERSLRDLLRVMDLMECELQYRLTPLPQLCSLISREFHGPVGGLFRCLGQELDSQISPDVSSCLHSALIQSKDLPAQTKRLAEELGMTLGSYDLKGQLIGLDCVKLQCRDLLDTMSQNREGRIRSYQTLGLCAGAAIAILFV